MKTKYLYLTFAVFLLLFVSSVSAVATCTDTDGQSLTTKGTVSGTYINGVAWSFSDSCSVAYPNKVSEAYCVGTNPSSDWFDCPTGSSCADGKCVASTTTCSSQGGSCRDLCYFGEASIGILNCGTGLCCKTGVSLQKCAEGTTTYYCSGLDTTKRYICNSITGITQTESCPTNQQCSNGNCVAKTYTPTCTDTDGSSLTTRGTVSGIFSNGVSYFTNDYCSVAFPDKVSEQVCLTDPNPLYGKVPSADWVACPTGTKCANGACVAPTTTCSSIGGTCKDICSVGTIAGGKLDCTNNYDCCIKGAITTCPPGTELPKAVPNDPHSYYICDGGVTSKVQCKGTATFSQGILCYGATSEGGKFIDGLLTPIGDALHSVIDPIFGINQTMCNTCSDWLLSKVGVKQCNAGFLSNITFGLLGKGLSCTVSLIKWGIIILAVIFLIFFLKEYSTKLKTFKSNRGLAWIVSIIVALLVGFMLFLFLNSILFWIVIAVIILIVFLRIYLRF
jgi:hypothetical protein